jgi:hypothetical protein
MKTKIDMTKFITVSEQDYNYTLATKLTAALHKLCSNLPDYNFGCEDYVDFAEYGIRWDLVEDGLFDVSSGWHASFSVVVADGEAALGWYMEPVIYTPDGAEDVTGVPADHIAPLQDCFAQFLESFHKATGISTDGLSLELVVMDEAARRELIEWYSTTPASKEAL